MRTSLLLLLLVTFMASTQGTYQQSGGTCCNLMDSNGWIYLQDEDIPTGSFSSVLFKMCSTGKVTIQLWRPVDSQDDQTFLPFYSATTEFFELAWELNYELLDEANAGEWIEVNLLDQDAPQFISTNYRLGIYTENVEEVPIPYDQTNGLKTLYKSYLSYFSSDFTYYQTPLAFEPLAYERTFIPYVRFCNTDTDGNRSCIGGEIPNLVVVAGPPGARGAQGVAGPPGPPGEFCFSADVPVQCDASESVVEQLNAIQDTNEELQNIINSISNNLQNNNLLTGACPIGFIPGSYGLGYCYKFSTERMSYGEADMDCIEDHHSLPVQIDNQLEEAFLISQAVQDMKATETDRSYYTRGLYNENSQTWVWYDELVLSRQSMTYTNWGQDEPAEDPLKVCMVMQVNVDEDEAPSAFWKAVRCTARHYFICKVAKACY